MLLLKVIQEYLEDQHNDWTTKTTERQSKIRITNCKASTNKIIVNTTKQMLHVCVNQRHTTINYSETTLLQKITNIISRMDSQP